MRGVKKAYIDGVLTTVISDRYESGKNTVDFIDEAGGKWRGWVGIIGLTEKGMIALTLSKKEPLE